MRAIAFVLTFVLLPGVALAMPRGGEKKSNVQTHSLTPEDEALIRTRERMKEEYRVMRQKRRKALADAAAASTMRSTGDGVPGWRNEGSAVGSTGPRRPVDGGPVVMEDVGEQSDSSAPGGLTTALLIAAGGVLLALFVRFYRPAILPALRRRKEEREVEPRKGGKRGMTVTLRPRRERYQGK